MELVDQILFALFQFTAWVCLYKLLFEKKKVPVWFSLFQVTALVVAYLFSHYYMEPFHSFISIAIFYLFVRAKGNTEENAHFIETLFTYLLSEVINAACSFCVHIIPYTLKIGMDVLTTVLTGIVEILICVLISKLLREKNIEGINKDFRSKSIVTTLCFAAVMISIMAANASFGAKAVAVIALVVCGILAAQWLMDERRLKKEEEAERKAEEARTERFATIIAEKDAVIEAEKKLNHDNNVKVTRVECELESMGEKLKHRPDDLEHYSDEFISGLENIKTERKDTARELERHETLSIKPDTGIPGVDSSLKYHAGVMADMDISFEYNEYIFLNELLATDSLTESLMVALFDNLLTNAVRSIERHKPEKRVVTLFLNADGDVLYIRVFDSGDYFDPEILHHLGATENTTNGTGFGVANILETLARCNASFYMKEFDPPTAAKHAKSITIRFDGAGMLKVESRKEEDNYYIDIKEALKRKIEKQRRVHMYQITDGDYQLEDVGPYCSFGIQSPSGLRIEDITVNFQALREFVNALNCYRASELHFMDMVLDFIG